MENDIKQLIKFCELFADVTYCNLRNLRVSKYSDPRPCTKNTYGPDFS